MNIHERGVGMIRCLSLLFHGCPRLNGNNDSERLFLAFGGLPVFHTVNLAISIILDVKGVAVKIERNVRKCCKRCL